jgi:hypothetical protein
MAINNKAQGATVAAVVLAIIAIFLVLIVFFMMLFPYNIYSNNLFSTKKIINTPTTKIIIDKSNERSYEVTCNYPYTKVGNTCCLDKNYNGICDSDEYFVNTRDNYYNYDNIYSNPCDYPYIRNSGRCCIDDNDNGFCDIDEHYDYRDFYDYPDLKNCRYGNCYDRGYSYNDGVSYKTWSSGSLNYPFYLSSFNVRASDISLDIRNDGKSDYVIKSIKIGNCVRKNSNEEINVGSKYIYNIDCDKISGSFNRDITIEYVRVGSYEILKSSGNIRGYLVSNRRCYWYEDCY